MENTQVYRSGIISIIGRPSTGKSSLMNLYCGEMVSIVSPLPQTTHNRIRGIVNIASGQIVFCDTPGFHRSKKAIAQHLRRSTLSSFNGVDALLYMLDCTRPPGEEELELVNILKTAKQPLFAAINKTDLLQDNREEVLGECMNFIKEHLSPKEIIPISIQSKENTDALLETLIATLPVGEALYPKDIYTDQDPLFRIREIIRGEAWKLLYHELPYSIYIDIYDTKIMRRPDQLDPKKLHINATIFVERESQKGTVVGKGGKTIEAIRRGSESILRTLFPYPVKVHLRVQVSPKWRKRTDILQKQIF